ncbi:hypothetical protein L1987_07370 [Smallanthus sonchifolius]|uniref:Uncharacterized protein n=1 Tax=Smallanthus sonchifolius TaxID=185202 RepID=A0ACB9K0E2_9ASTR|nr:hypothetical protein L1987_07370 [Smallanthus sonchifolius]
MRMKLLMRMRMKTTTGSPMTQDLVLMMININPNASHKPQSMAVAMEEACTRGKIRLVMLDRNTYTGKDKQEAGKSSKNKYRRLLVEIDVDEKWFPLLDYLATFGLKDSHFIQMYSRHMSSLQINVTAAKERLDYLMSVGVKSKDIKKVLTRQPQILQYTVESNLKSHVAFLVSLGIQDSRIGQV